MPNSRDNKKASMPTHRVLRFNIIDSKQPSSTTRHRSIPILGYYLEEWLGISTMLAEKRERFGPIYSSNYFIHEWTYVSDYDAIVEALRDEEVFRTKDAFDSLDPMFGKDNVVVSDFDVHRKGCNRLTPVFAPALLPQYMGYINNRTCNT